MEDIATLIVPAMRHMQGQFCVFPGGKEVYLGTTNRWHETPAEEETTQWEEFDPDNLTAWLGCSSSPGCILPWERPKTALPRIHITQETIPPCFLCYATTIALSFIKTMNSHMVWYGKHFKVSWTAFISNTLTWRFFLLHTYPCCSQVM